MAVRTLRRFLAAIVLTALTVAPAAACFGPKLYVGVTAGPRQEMLFALVSLYVQEKTGVESERKGLSIADDPGRALAAEQVDLVFAAAPLSGAETVLAIPGYPVLVSGSRPLNDLQFTTVVPALRKLATLLTPRDLVALEARIAAGDKPLAAARWLCMERRWL
ncbi:MAG: hypothetical protein FIB02_03545 [Desulfuromonas sp.]|nr:hypothetical protein [Desulfuromonas sp.]